MFNIKYPELGTPTPAYKRENAALKVFLLSLVVLIPLLLSGCTQETGRIIQEAKTPASDFRSFSPSARGYALETTASRKTHFRTARPQTHRSAEGAARVN